MWDVMDTSVNDKGTKVFDKSARTAFKYVFTVINDSAIFSSCFLKGCVEG